MSESLNHDDTINQAIAGVVQDRATYGYRRMWVRLRIDEHRVNHKRVYRMMRDEGLLLFRRGHKPMDTRKHEGKVAVKGSDMRWCSKGLEVDLRQRQLLDSHRDQAFR
jgi:putative transposase